MDADPSCALLWSCLLQSASLQLSAVNVSDAAQGAAGAQVQPPPAGIQLVDLTILTDPQQPVRVLDATHPSVKDLITVAPTSLATFVQQSRINIGAAVLATSLGNVEIIAKETSEQLKSALSLHYYVGWMLVLGKVLKEHGGGDITTREQWMTWLTSDATKHYVDRVRKELSKHWKTPSVQDALRYSNDADIELATPVLSAKAAKKLTDEERAKYRMAINANSCRVIADLSIFLMTWSFHATWIQVSHNNSLTKCMSTACHALKLTPVVLCFSVPALFFCPSRCSQSSSH